MFTILDPSLMSKFLNYCCFMALVLCYTAGKFDYYLCCCVSFLNRRFGSLFLLPRVPIGSLFHKKLGPYFSARRSLKVLTSVQLLQLSFGSFRSGGSLGQALLKLFFPSNFCPYSKALSFCSTEYTFSEHSSTNFLQSARDHAIYQKLPNI